MTTINVVGFSSSKKTPGIFLSVVLGGVATSAAAAVKKILLMGNKITTAIPLASPLATSIAAGTQSDATPVALNSADTAATYFGRGAELHRMAKRALRQYPDATVTGVSVAESAGNRSTVGITFVTSANAAYTVRFRLGEYVIDVAVANGDNVTAIADTCADAILSYPDLPWTAQNAAGILTLSAKHPGPRGNRLPAWAAFVDSAGNETVIISTGTVTSPGATTGQWTTGTTSGGVVFGATGTTQDTFALALASVLTTRYDRIALACYDSANVALVKSQVATMAGVTSQKLQQYIFATNTALATAITLATGVNDARGQCVWSYQNPISCEEIAAQVAAARLIGDAQAGGTLVGEATDPAANLDGCELKDVLQQTAVGDRPLATDIESALNNGITPLSPSGSNPGFMTIVRSVTTRSLDSLSQPNFANLDTSTVTIPDYCADDLRSKLATTYKGKKLGVDASDGSPPTAANVVTPSIVRGKMAAWLKEYEEAGIIRNVDTDLPLLQVIADTTVSGRLLAEVPVDPMPGLHQTAGNVRQVG
mgnify:CR=1 FL=1